MSAPKGKLFCDAANIISPNSNGNDDLEQFDRLEYFDHIHLKGTHFKTDICC